MKILVLLLCFFSSVSFSQGNNSAESLRSIWFVPEGCKSQFLKYIDQPYNVKRGVLLSELQLEDIPIAYEGGVFYEVVYPADKVLQMSLKANVVEIFESCSENAFIKLPKEKFDFSEIEELIVSMGGRADDLSIKISKDGVVVYFSKNQRGRAEVPPV